MPLITWHWSWTSLETGGLFAARSIPNTKPTAIRHRAICGLRSIDVSRCWSRWRVPVYGVEGFEADDVIATIVERMQKEHPDLEIRIISKDKDLQQLLAEHVAMLNPRKVSGSRPTDRCAGAL